MAKRDSIAMLKAKISVLKKARKLIKNKIYCYICHAIGCVQWDRDTNLVEFKAGDQLLIYIRRALGNWGALGEWLQYNKNPAIRKRPRDLTNQRKYRLQWIDWMVQSLEEDLAQKGK